VAAAKGAPRAELARRYGEVYSKALARPATRGRHVNVLQHMAGYFKDLATPDERQELQEAIADYRAGLVPLVVPVTLVKHHVRRHGVAYLAEQRYLEPHPKELMLRNHA
ncbi:MAG TPA: YbgA family protein, partial [Anaeromyxobacteraceae bacterium]|nr:YbgA family protein [Anaeromyxobacteraceae bacterium]